MISVALMQGLFYIASLIHLGVSMSLGLSIPVPTCTENPPAEHQSVKSQPAPSGRVLTVGEGKGGVLFINS